MKPLYLFALLVILSISSCHFFENLGKQPCSPPENCGTYDQDLVDTTDPDKPFMKGQLVLTNTKKGGLEMDSTELGIKFIENYIKEIYLDPGTKTNKPKTENPAITVRRCICDEYIFIIEIKDIIGSENNVAEAGNRPRKPSGEGWSFSLNYLIPSSVQKENIPRFITGNNYEDFENGVSLNKPIVAILDSGIDINLFSDRTGLYDKNGEVNICSIDDDENGYNFVANIPNGDIKDDNGHGTAVSLAYKYGLDRMGNHWGNQRLLPVKVLDSCGVGTIYSTVCGLAYARRKKAAVVNCSWGLNFNNFQLQRAVNEFNYKVNIVCSAGNDGRMLGSSPGKNHFPSGYGHSYMPVDQDDDIPDGWVITPSKRNVFEVGALDDGFIDSCPSGSMVGLASYSNRRPSSLGTNLYAERGGSAELLLPTPLNCCMEGTSFAAPLFAAGIITEGLTPGSYSSPPKNTVEDRCTANPSNSIYSYFNSECNN